MDSRFSWNNKELPMTPYYITADAYTQYSIAPSFLERLIYKQKQLQVVEEQKSETEKEVTVNPTVQKRSKNVDRQKKHPKDVSAAKPQPSQEASDTGNASKSKKQDKVPVKNQGNSKKLAPSRFSTLTSAEQKTYIELYLKYSRHIPNKPNEQEVKDINKFRELQALVQAEQHEFQLYLEKAAHYAPEIYSHLPPGADIYMQEWLSLGRARAAKYPRYYVQHDSVSLVPPKAYKEPPNFHHVQTLLQVGQVPRVLLPQMQGKVKAFVPVDCGKIFKRYPTKQRDNAWKKVCSEDENAEKLAVKYRASIVMSSSGLHCLMDNQNLDRAWELPVVVKSYNVRESEGEVVRRVVYIDKPFPHKNMTENEKCKQFYRIALKSYLLHPDHCKSQKFGKPSERVANVQETDLTAGEYDIGDLETFGSPGRSSSSTKPKRPSTFSRKLLTDIKKSFIKSSDPDLPETNPLSESQEGLAKADLSTSLPGGSEEGTPAEYKPQIAPMEESNLIQSSKKTESIKKTQMEVTDTENITESQNDGDVTDVSMNCSTEVAISFRKSTRLSSSQSSLENLVGEEAVEESIQQVDGCSDDKADSKRSEGKQEHSEGGVSKRRGRSAKSQKKAADVGDASTSSDNAESTDLPVGRRTRRSSRLSENLQRDVASSDSDATVSSTPGRKRGQRSSVHTGRTPSNAPTMSTEAPNAEAAVPKKKKLSTDVSEAETESDDDNKLVIDTGEDRCPSTPGRVTRAGTRFSASVKHVSSIQDENPVVLTRKRTRSQFLLAEYTNSAEVRTPIDEVIKSSKPQATEKAEEKDPPNNPASTSPDAPASPDSPASPDPPGISDEPCKASVSGSPDKCSSPVGPGTADSPDGPGSPNGPGSPQPIFMGAAIKEIPLSPTYKSQENLALVNEPVKEKTLPTQDKIPKSEPEVEQSRPKHPPKQTDQKKKVLPRRKGKATVEKSKPSSGDFALDSILQAQTEMLQIGRPKVQPSPQMAATAAAATTPAAPSWHSPWLPLEDPTAYKSPEQHNQTYSLWQLGNIPLIIRCSLHGNVRDKKQNISYVSVCPKLEYQYPYGLEQLSSSDTCRSWLSVFIRPGTSFIRARVKIPTSEILLLEQLNPNEVLPPRSAYSPAGAVIVLYDILDHLLKLKDGYYLLSHTEGNTHTHIKKNIDRNVGVYDLHNAHATYADMEVNNKHIPWLPVDTSIILPTHRHVGRVPGTFDPKDSRIPKTQPKKKKKGKKKGKKQNNKDQL